MARNKRIMVGPSIEKKWRQNEAPSYNRVESLTKPKFVTELGDGAIVLNMPAEGKQINENINALSGTKNVLKDLSNNNFFQAIRQNNIGISSNYIRTGHSMSKSSVPIQFGRYNNLSANTPLAFAHSSISHYLGVVEKNISGHIKSNLHVLDTETIGRKFGDSTYQFITELAIHTQDLSNHQRNVTDASSIQGLKELGEGTGKWLSPYSGGNSAADGVTEYNILRGLDQAMGQEFLDELELARKYDPTLSGDYGYLKVIASRAHRYGSAQFEADQHNIGDAVFYGVKKLGQDIDFIDGTQEIGYNLADDVQFGQVMQGVRNLMSVERMTTKNVNNTGLNAADYMMVHALGNMKQDIINNNGIVTGFNYLAFDRNHINANIKAMYVDAQRQLARKDISAQQRAAHEGTLRFINSKFGGDLTINTGNNTVLDIYTNIKAITSTGGINSTYDGNYLARGNGMRARQEHYIAALLGQGAVDQAHSGIDDIRNLKTLIMGNLGSVKDGKFVQDFNYAGFLQSGMEANQKKLNKFDVRRGQVFRATGALGMPTGDGKGAFSFAYNPKNKTTYVSQSGGMGAVIPDSGGYIPKNYNIGSHVRKDTFFRVNRTFSYDINQEEFADIAALMPSLSGSQIYGMEVEALTSLDAASNPDAVKHYIMYSSLEEFEDHISSNAEFVGHFGKDNNFKINRYYSKELMPENIREMVEDQVGKVNAEILNENIFESGMHGEKAVKGMHKHSEIIEQQARAIIKSDPKLAASLGVAQSIIDAKGKPIIPIENQVAIYNHVTQTGKAIDTINNLAPRARTGLDLYAQKMDNESVLFNKIQNMLSDNSGVYFNNGRTAGEVYNGFKGSSNKSVNMSRLYSSIEEEALQWKYGSDYKNALFGQIRNQKVDMKNLAYFDLSTIAGGDGDVIIGKNGLANNMIEVQLNSWNNNSMANKILTVMHGQDNLTEAEKVMYRKTSVAHFITGFIEQHDLNQKRYKPFQSLYKSISQNGRKVDFDEEGALDLFRQALQGYKKSNRDFLINKDVLERRSRYINRGGAAVSDAITEFMGHLDNNGVGGSTQFLKNKMQSLWLDSPVNIIDSTQKNGRGKFIELMMQNTKFFDSKDKHAGGLSDVQKKVRDIVLRKSDEGQRKYFGAMYDGMKGSGINFVFQNGEAFVRSNKKGEEYLSPIRLGQATMHINKTTGALETHIGNMQVHNILHLEFDEKGQLSTFDSTHGYIHAKNAKKSDFKRTKDIGQLTIKDAPGYSAKELTKEAQLSGAFGEIGSGAKGYLDETSWRRVLYHASLSDSWVKDVGMSDDVRNQIQTQYAKFLDKDAVAGMEDVVTSHETLPFRNAALIHQIGKSLENGKYDKTTRSDLEFISEWIGTEINKASAKHGGFSITDIHNKTGGAFQALGNNQRPTSFNKKQVASQAKILQAQANDAVNGRTILPGEIVTTPILKARTYDVSGYSYTKGSVVGNLTTTTEQLNVLMRRSYNDIVGQNNTVAKNVIEKKKRVHIAVAERLAITEDQNIADARVVEAIYGQEPAWQKRITGSKELLSFSDVEGIDPDVKRAYDLLENAIGTVEEVDGKLVYKQGQLDIVDAGASTLVLRGHGGAYEHIKAKEESVIRHVYTQGDRNIELTNDELNTIINKNKDRFYINGRLKDGVAILETMDAIAAENDLKSHIAVQSIRQRGITKLIQNDVEKGATSLNLTAMGKYDENIVGLMKELGYEKYVTSGNSYTDIGIETLLNKYEREVGGLDAKLSKYGYSSIGDFVAQSNIEKQTLNEYLYSDMLKGKDVVTISNYSPVKHKNDDYSATEAVANIKRAYMKYGYSQEEATNLTAELISDKDVGLFSYNGKAANIVKGVEGSEIILDDKILASDSGFQFNHGGMKNAYNRIMDGGVKGGGPGPNLMPTVVIPTHTIKDKNGNDIQQYTEGIQMFGDMISYTGDDGQEVMLGELNFSTMSLNREEDYSQMNYLWERQKMNELSKAKASVVSLQADVAQYDKDLASLKAQGLNKSNEIVRHTTAARQKAINAVVGAQALEAKAREAALTAMGGAKTVKINNDIMNQLIHKNLERYTSTKGNGILRKEFSGFMEGSDAWLKIDKDGGYHRRLTNMLKGKVDDNFNIVGRQYYYSENMRSIIQQSWYDQTQEVYNSKALKGMTKQQKTMYKEAYESMKQKAKTMIGDDNVVIGMDAVKDYVNAASIQMAKDINDEVAKGTMTLEMLQQGYGNHFEIIDYKTYKSTYGNNNKFVKSIVDKNIVIDLGEEMGSSRFVAMDGSGSVSGNKEIRTAAQAKIDRLLEKRKALALDPSNNEKADAVVRIAKEISDVVTEAYGAKEGPIRKTQYFKLKDGGYRAKVTGAVDVEDAIRRTASNVTENTIFDTAKVNGISLRQAHDRGIHHDFAFADEETFRQAGFFEKENWGNFGRYVDGQWRGAQSEEEVKQLLRSEGTLITVNRSPENYVESVVLARAYLTDKQEGITISKYTQAKMMGDFDGDNDSIQFTKMVRARHENGLVKEQTLDYGAYRRLREAKEVSDDEFRKVLKSTGYSREQYEAFEEMDTMQIFAGHSTVNKFEYEKSKLSKMGESKSMIAKADQIKNGVISSGGSTRSLSAKQSNASRIGTKSVFSRLGMSIDDINSESALNTALSSGKLLAGEAEILTERLGHVKSISGIMSQGVYGVVGPMNKLYSGSYNYTANLLYHADKGIDDIAVGKATVAKDMFSLLTQEFLQGKHMELTENKAEIRRMHKNWKLAEGSSSVEARLKYIDKTIEGADALVTKSKVASIFDHNVNLFEQLGVDTSVEMDDTQKAGHVLSQFRNFLRNTVGTAEGKADIDTVKKTLRSGDLAAVRALSGYDTTMAKLNLVSKGSQEKAQQVMAEASDALSDVASDAAGGAAQAMAGRAAGRGNAMVALAVGAGLGLMAFTTGKPLAGGGANAQQQENHMTPVPNFSDGEAHPTGGQKGYIIDVKAETNKGRRAIQNAFRGAAMSTTGGGVNVNMNIRDTRRHAGFTDKDIEQYIGRYM